MSLASRQFSNRAHELINLVKFVIKNLSTAPNDLGALEKTVPIDWGHSGASEEKAS